MHPDRAEQGSQDFVPRQLNEEPVHDLSREAVRAGWLTFRALDGFEVTLPELVVAEMMTFGRRAAPNEWYALLVGRRCADARGSYVVIDGAVLDPDARASPGFVETTIESEQSGRRLASLLHPASIPLGWAHGHHRCGAVYSATDRATQATWNHPNSVGIVVDPWSSDPVGVYRGPGAERLTAVGSGSVTRAEARAAQSAQTPRQLLPEPSAVSPAATSVSESVATIRSRLLVLVGVGALALAGSVVSLAATVRALAGRVDAFEVERHASGSHRHAADEGQVASQVAKLTEAIEALKPQPMTVNTPLPTDQERSTDTPPTAIIKRVAKPQRPKQQAIGPRVVLAPTVQPVNVNPQFAAPIRTAPKATSRSESRVTRPNGGT